MAKLRIAVAGAGLIGRAHIALLRKSQSCELAAIADPTSQAAAIAKEIGVPHFAELERMLDETKPQRCDRGDAECRTCAERTCLYRTQHSGSGGKADHRNR